MVVEPLAGFLHYGQVAGAAHDNANDWFHNMYVYDMQFR